MVNPKVVLLIFVTGKIVLTGMRAFFSILFLSSNLLIQVGAKSIKDCQTALTNILPVIDPFKTIPGSVEVKKNADENRQVRGRKGR